MQSLRDCNFGGQNQREMIKRLEKLELTDLLSALQRKLSARKEQGKEMPTLTLRTTTGKATTANDSRSGKGPNSKNRSDDKIKVVASETRQVVILPPPAEASKGMTRSY